jgi:hypothetical protein
MPTALENTKEVIKSPAFYSFLLFCLNAGFGFVSKAVKGGEGFEEAADQAVALIRELGVNATDPQALVAKICLGLFVPQAADPIDLSNYPALADVRDTSFFTHMSIAFDGNEEFPYGTNVFLLGLLAALFLFMHYFATKPESVEKFNLLTESKTDYLSNRDSATRAEKVAALVKEFFRTLGHLIQSSSPYLLFFLIPILVIQFFNLFFTAPTLGHVHAAMELCNIQVNGFVNSTEDFSNPYDVVDAGLATDDIFTLTLAATMTAAGTAPILLLLLAHNKRLRAEANNQLSERTPLTEDTASINDDAEKRGWFARLTSCINRPSSYNPIP